MREISEHIMKKLFYLIVTLIFFISCNNSKQPSEKIIGIYVQNKTHDYQDVIIIGEISGDSILKISDWDKSTREYVVNRKPYLEKYSKYYLGSGGDSLESITVDTILKKDFQCSSLTVGHTDKYFLNIRNEFSLVSNHDSFQNYLRNEEFVIEPESMNIVKSKLKKALITKRNKNADKDISIDELFRKSQLEEKYYYEILQSVDLNSDGIKEILVKLTSVRENEKLSVLLIFNITENYVKDVGEIDPWDRGYNLIGVTDLNNNGNYELIFQGRGYESIGFEIYEMQNNKFKQLLYIVPYGC